MTTNPQDFDGCNLECRKAGAHTLRWGGCEHASKPEPTVSMSKIYTDREDGYPSIGFDTYTVRQLAGLIAPALHRAETQTGNQYADMARAAAHAIVHRNDEAAAVPVSPPPATRADDRAAVELPAGHVAPTDWIDGHPQLEAIAAAVWERCRTEDTSLVVDDPRNIAVAALAAVLAELPPPADRAAVLPAVAVFATLVRQRADHIEAAHARMRDRLEVTRVRVQRLHTPGENGECQHCHHSHPCPTMQALDGELRRMADEAQQQPDTEPRVVAYRSPGTRTLYCLTCARQENGWQPVIDADEQAVCDFCGGRVHTVAAQTLGGIVARYLPGATPAAAPFIPPAHYRRDDGVECCVHTIPVGPDSCPHCRELADDEGQPS